MARTSAIRASVIASSAANPSLADRVFVHADDGANSTASTSPLAEPVETTSAKAAFVNELAKRGGAYLCSSSRASSASSSASAARGALTEREIEMLVESLLHSAGVPKQR